MTRTQDIIALGMLGGMFLSVGCAALGAYTRLFIKKTQVMEDYGWVDIDATRVRRALARSMIIAFYLAVLAAVEILWYWV